MSDPQEQLLRRAYEAFNARDVDGALATMHADVDWPNGMEGGRLHGHQEVREYWRRQFDLIDSLVEPRQIEQRPDGQVVGDGPPSRARPRRDVISGTRSSIGT